MNKALQFVESVEINHQFCGPPESGNGGYVCGRLAHYLEGPATVRLMIPPPLDTRLDVVGTDGEFQLRHDEQVVARAWPGAAEIELLPSPGLDTARRAGGRFAGFSRHAFPGCFVCGTDRSEGDGLLIHAGPAPGDSGRSDMPVHHVACTWIPHDSFCRPDGVVHQEFIWAALDCPGGWAFLSSGEEVALLGEFSVEIDTPPRAGQEYVVAGWEISREGRKRLTASAIYDSEGQPLAWARATWITIDFPDH